MRLDKAMNFLSQTILAIWLIGQQIKQVPLLKATQLLVAITCSFSSKYVLNRSLIPLGKLDFQLLKLAMAALVDNACI